MFPSTLCRRLTRPRMNGAGAIAISVHASSRPAIPAQSADWSIGPPLSTGTIPNARFDAAAVKKPPASSRSSRRPSTEKRAPARIVTSAPASIITVVSTVPSSGR